MAIIDRNGAEVLIPVEQGTEVWQSVPKASTFMRLAKRLPDLSATTRALPVLSTLPMAYFVEGDTGFRKTTTAKWDNVRLTAQEIACICPVAENVLDDSDYRIWESVLPAIIEKIGQVFDQAVFHGINKPDSFPTGIIPGAIAAGNRVALSGNLYKDLLGKDGVIEKLENSGYIPNGYVGAVKMRSVLRGAVDANGQPLFRASYRDGVGAKSPYELDGEPILFAENGGMFADDGALLVAGDFQQAVWAVRRDISIKLLTEAMLQDPVTKQIIANLAQEGLVALKVTFRAGWALPNPATALNEDNSTRYPFAVLTQEA